MRGYGIALSLNEAANSHSHLRGPTSGRTFESFWSHVLFGLGDAGDIWWHPTQHGQRRGASMLPWNPAVDYQQWELHTSNHMYCQGKSSLVLILSVCHGLVLCRHFTSSTEGTFAIARCTREAFALFSYITLSFLDIWIGFIYLLSMREPLLLISFTSPLRWKCVMTVKPREEPKRLRSFEFFLLQDHRLWWRFRCATMRLIFLDIDGVLVTRRPGVMEQTLGGNCLNVHSL